MMPLAWLVLQHVSSPIRHPIALSCLTLGPGVCRLIKESTTQPLDICVPYTLWFRATRVSFVAAMRPPRRTEQKYI